MRIKHAAAWLVRMPMAVPYAVAYATADTAENVFLRIETSGGAMGLGCAAPDEHVTGESVAATLEVLQNEIVPALTDLDAAKPSDVLAKVASLAPGRPGILAAVDLALWDLRGRCAGKPVAALLGARRNEIATFITIGILPIDATLDAARAWTKQGFDQIKVKGGMDPELDAARMHRLREELGRHVLLSLDANQGYDEQAARIFLRETKNLGVAFLEQPVPKADLDALAVVAAVSGQVRVMADEPVCRPADLLALQTRGGPSLINLKLMKSGGITGGQALLAAGREAAFQFMVGCMDESALGIAAGLAVALSDARVVYADLDGHIGLGNDPAASCVELRNGKLRPSSKPGLGW